MASACHRAQVHALHMRHGSAVIEVRNEGFASRAPWSWLELHKRWVTRYGGPAHSRPLHFTPITLPANATVVRAAEQQCFDRNAKKRAKMRAANRTKIPQVRASDGYGWVPIGTD